MTSGPPHFKKPLAPNVENDESGASTLSTQLAAAEVATDKLLHELQVHQIELELQNELLADAQSVADAECVHYRDLYNFAPTGYFTVNREDIIAQLNIAGAALFGRERDSIVGNRFAAYVATSDISAFEQFCSQTFDTERTQVCEIALLSEPGVEKFARLAACPAPEPEHIFIAALDVTESRRLLAERAKLEAELQRIQRLDSIGILAGGIAHDFNNLLSGIFSNIELAIHRLESGETLTVIPTLRRALGVFERARGLTRQLITFSSGGTPNRKTIALPSLLNGAATFALCGSNVELQLDLADDLRPCDVDENQISQVIDNLVRNAREATPNGGTIRIRARNGNSETDAAESDTVHVEISDDGAGITPEALPHVFDPFFTTKPSGNGLGLAIAHSIIKQHDGSLTVRSSPGAGATFTLSLPASHHPLDEYSGPLSPKEFRGGSILILDDEDDLRTILSEILKTNGYSVIAASNCEEATKFYGDALRDGHPFDAVILDLTLRGGPGGEETLARLRKLNPAVRVLASSGYSSEPVMANPVAHGFCGAIPKPYRIAEMLTLIHDIVHRQAAGDE